MGSAKDAFVEVAAGTTIVREGEPGSEMYIIESGTVEIVRGGRSEPLAVLEAGDFFGEMAILEDQPRFASAVAKAPCRLLRIDRAAFGDVLRANVEIPIRIMRKLTERLRRSEQRAAEAHAALAEFRRKLSSREPARADAAPAPEVAAPAAAPERGEPVLAPEPAPPAPAASGVCVLRHPSGHEIRLEGKSEYLVGRPDPVTGIDPEVNLGPFDVARSLSRRHAKVLFQDGAWLLREDVGTTNGTYVNGVRLETGRPVTLARGDTLKFGSVEVEVTAV